MLLTCVALIEKLVFYEEEEKIKRTSAQIKCYSSFAFLES